jgi:hypothetical protein
MSWFWRSDRPRYFHHRPPRDGHAPICPFHRCREKRCGFGWVGNNYGAQWICPIHRCGHRTVRHG